MTSMSHFLSVLILGIIYSGILLVDSSVLQLQPKDLESPEVPNLRIVGGRPANQSQTRHQVSIRLKAMETKNGFGYGHMCGGSLIEPDTVLTAAHCLYKESGKLRKAKDFVVVMGTMNLTVKTSDTLVYSVKKFTVHRRYSAKTVQNDIALLKLSQSVPVNHSKVTPIRLTSREVTLGTKCQITGWGSMRNEGPMSYSLQTADILIQDITRCNASNSYGGILKPGMMCAGYFEGGIDSCQGDSGGPMVCNGILSGVISWGYKCALARYPGIYSDVYYFRDWIETGSSIKLVNSLMIMTIGVIMTLLM